MPNKRVHIKAYRRRGKVVKSHVRTVSVGGQGAGKEFESRKEQLDFKPKPRDVASGVYVGKGGNVWYLNDETGYWEHSIRGAEVRKWRGKKIAGLKTIKDIIPKAEGAGYVERIKAKMTPKQLKKLGYD